MLWCELVTRTVKKYNTSDAVNNTTTSTDSRDATVHLIHLILLVLFLLVYYEVTQLHNDSKLQLCILYILSLYFCFVAISHQLERLREDTYMWKVAIFISPVTRLLLFCKHSTKV